MGLVKIFVVLCALSCWIALALIYVDVETVLGTGPVVLVLGILTTLYAKKHGDWRFVFLGGLHIFIAVFFFGLVNVLSWSPSEATEPFRWMGRAYTAGWTVAVFLVFRPRKDPEGPAWDEALGHVTGAQHRGPGSR